MTPRKATGTEDWPAILALIRRAFAGMEGRIDPPSSMHRLTPEAIAAQAREGEVWLAGDPLAACLFLTPKPDCLYLGKLAVDPSMQRRGLARALVATAEARARALGLPALELQTRVELVENHATFRALGFRQVAATAHPGFDRPTSLTFRKDLFPAPAAATA
ncbi:GNAT family N-acetyltransferase [Rhodobacter sp. CZR27]|uniref:GNAT family N-acetyltransferase n=1 Tax=Rhodobacter sp. CZR27 TaxID=2033869 RepID=UPI000BBE5F4C|nr:GNAT family N-acetyltransferase [Rhodobacter sp. CZR27]